ncbi:hypothetical protein HX109_11340 [Galbibacter sp. BG1]|uniref:hypothetical protein n=1 Tax=Galbibacter sp. BG1 TaxID=1170699 RepID=UPI0015B8C3E9|nr:hypothetical protein [Galbibacter sp. BG1]QLE02116.1 hypothetical protein HX109_11340 [Galbibacter sp. BG1]
MFKTDWKHTLSYFFLVAFLLLRVLSLHEYSHVDNDSDYENCELCTIISCAKENTPLENSTLPVATSATPFFDFPQHKFSNVYASPYHKILLLDYHYNKPPPFNFWG